MDESTLFVTLFFCVVGNVTMLTVAHQHINDSMQQKKNRPTHRRTCMYYCVGTTDWFSGKRKAVINRLSIQHLRHLTHTELAFAALPGVDCVVTNTLIVRRTLSAGQIPLRCPAR